MKKGTILATQIKILKWYFRCSDDAKAFFDNSTLLEGATNFYKPVLKY
jgi:hypothetical protein